MIDEQSIPQIDYLYLDMNGIIYRCVRVSIALVRMTQSYSNRNSCLNSLKKCGLKSLTILILLSTCSNPPRWSFLLLTELLLDAKWITKDLVVSVVHKTTNNILKDCMDTLKWQTVKKTLKTILFHLEHPLCSNSIKCFISLFKKRLKKITIGRVWVLSSLVRILLEKENTKY